jgi:hypothetical protein
MEKKSVEEALGRASEQDRLRAEGVFRDARKALDVKTMKEVEEIGPPKPTISRPDPENAAKTKLGTETRENIERIERGSKEPTATNDEANQPQQEESDNGKKSEFRRHDSNFESKFRAILQGQCISLTPADELSGQSLTKEQGSLSQDNSGPTSSDAPQRDSPQELSR